MRTGRAEIRRPLSRGRGMPAAALLGIAIAGTYAVLGSVALTSVGSDVVVPVERGFRAITRVVPFHRAHARDYASALPGASRAARAATGGVTIQFGRLTSGTALADAVLVTNTSTAPLDMHLAVLGAPGVAATFAGSGRSTMRVGSGRQASISVASDPLRAGPIAGTLRVDLGHGLHLDVALRGAQAPVAPGAITATAAAGGAVKLAWAPSGSSGVGGYALFRRSGSGPWSRIAGLVHGTSFTDPTGTDATRFDYRVAAAAAGVAPELLGPPGAAGSALTDATGPDAPTTIVVPPISAANVASVPVEVDLPPTSLASDSVAVTLSDGTHTASATAPGGSAAATVAIDASSLADGPIAISVTLADAAGNVTHASATTTKDTAAPAAPVAVSAPGINAENVDAVPVTVDPGPAAIADDQVRVQLQSGDKTAVATAAVGSGPVSVDASALPDGTVAVTAWVLDAAGNTSPPLRGSPVTKDVTSPEAPTWFGVRAGPANPSGYVNAASQGDVTVAADFAAPVDPAATVELTVAERPTPVAVSGDTVTARSLDLSALPDGPIDLVLRVTDAAGNVTVTKATATKDTVAPRAPGAFGVPAGDQNPAGWVNLATQRDAAITASFGEAADAASVTASAGGIDLGTARGGATVTFHGDLSGLPDGPVDLRGTVTDAAGNTADFSGSTQKDTVAPDAPVSAHVVSDPPDTITAATAGCVTVRVEFAQPTDRGGTVTMTLWDEGDSTAKVVAEAGGSTVDVGCIDATALPEGDVHLRGEVTDAAGNVTSFAGTQAAKTP